MSLLRDSISEMMMVMIYPRLHTKVCHHNHTGVDINMVHFGQKQQKMYFVIIERNYRVAQEETPEINQSII